jgi:hypothetical protein
VLRVGGYPFTKILEDSELWVVAMSSSGDIVLQVTIDEPRVLAPMVATQGIQA